MNEIYTRSVAEITCSRHRRIAMVRTVLLTVVDAADTLNFTSLTGGLSVLGWFSMSWTLWAV